MLKKGMGMMMMMMMMKSSYTPSVIIIIFMIPFLLLIPMASAADSASCTWSCGSITNISFPFSLTNRFSPIDPSCPSSSYMDNPYLHLFCNHTEGKLYALENADFILNTSKILKLEVKSIHTDSLIVRVDVAQMQPLVPGTDLKCNYSEMTSVLLPPFGTGPYVISDDNKFVGFGCTMGTIYMSDIINHDPSNKMVDYYDQSVTGGCTVLLPDNRNNGDCGNHTCCAVSLPLASELRLRSAYYFADTYQNYENLFGVNETDPECRCSRSYAALYHPNFTDIDSRVFHMKITWALPYEKDLNQTEVMKIPSYACTLDQTSDFVPVPEVPGYRCKCKDGFVGDGYANGTRCTNVNECEDPLLNACLPHTTCVDTFGSYTCKCDSRFHVGDGRIDGSGCKLSPTLGFLLILLVIIMLLMSWVKRMKRMNFMQNGGLQLQEFIKSKRHDHVLIQIFTRAELKAATNNYADDMKIGAGGFGAVYKGKLETGELVAVKKALVSEDGDNKEFVNELIILTQIHHKHIVKLLGCCLETKTPLLVYEYASNGTLADHLLETLNVGYMGWDRRLTIALQSAEALSYLHRAASPPILHRDVKSTNILLDDQWNAKVGDFGVSRLVPNGEQHISTVVQGTLGYLDPEYFQTLQLTDKSDVYSMGVMLVELITSLKPVDPHHRDPRFSNLALLFLHHIKEEKLDEIIDPRLEMVDNSVLIRSSILGVAALAHRCLALMGHDRPSMIEVEHELHDILSKLHASEAKDSATRLQFVGALTMENREGLIHSDSSQWKGDSLVYGISSDLLR